MKIDLHVHSSDLSLCGHIPSDELIDRYIEAGYDGFVSVEFEGMEENLPALEQGLSFLRSIV
jgi:sugar phosphate isomerase/epimerase